jgi:ABC-type glycerol-3-phosphate transport system substrate-binding protein
MYIEKQNGGIEMKKLLVVLLALTMMLPAFVSAQTLDPNEKVTLNLFGTANFVDVGPDGMMDLLSGVEMPGYNELIAEWNKLHPNVEIVVKTCPWDSWITSIQTAVLGGDVDIILHGATLTELCEPLDPYLQRDPEYAAKLFATENKRFGDLSKTMVAGIQYVIEPSIAYLDNEIFEHYGVEIPDASWTWDELIEIARKCTGTDPVTGKQTYGVQLCYTDTQNIFQNYYKLAMAYNVVPITYGKTPAESTIDFSSDKMLDVFKKLQALSECCAPNVREGAYVVHDLTPENDTAIRWRTLAYDQYRKIKAAGIEDRFTFIPLPVIEEGPAKGAHSTYFGSYNMAISNNSKNKDWAWEFIKFVTTEPVAVEWTLATGGIPNCEYGMELLKEAMGDKAQAPITVLETLPEGFCNTTNENYDNVNFGTFSTSLVTVLKDLVYGTTTPEEAIAAWKNATDEYMAFLK